MPNSSGNAYGLSTFCPIINGNEQNQSFASKTREYLQKIEPHLDSPMAQVPNTYLARFFILNDTNYESYPHHLDHLKSKYLVFTSNFYGDRDAYLKGMWEAISHDIKKIWKYCVGFNKVHDAQAFVKYIQECQVETTFYFNGSTDDPLEEQLKALYLKQKFSDFVFSHQGVEPATLLKDFKEFIQRTQPHVLAFPTWRAGADTLETVEKSQP